MFQFILVNYVESNHKLSQYEQASLCLSSQEDEPENGLKPYLYIILYNQYNLPTYCDFEASVIS